MEFVRLVLSNSERTERFPRVTKEHHKLASASSACHSSQCCPNAPGEALGAFPYAHGFSSGPLGGGSAICSSFALKETPECEVPGSRRQRTRVAISSGGFSRADSVSAHVLCFHKWRHPQAPLAHTKLIFGIIWSPPAQLPSERKPIQNWNKFGQYGTTQNQQVFLLGTSGGLDFVTNSNNHSFMPLEPC